MSGLHALTTDALFGNLSLEVVVAAEQDSQAWRLFNAAHQALSRGDVRGASGLFEEITTMPGIASRHRLQAWRFLRDIGVGPPSLLEKQVLGVIFEAGMDSGHDLLAVYADRTAHYDNFSGSGVIWKRPDASLDPFINPVLDNAGAIVSAIGVWTGARRPPTSLGQLRVSILTPLGIHFGEGPFDALERDPFARPVVQAGTNLMLKLTSLPDD